MGQNGNLPPNKDENKKMFELPPPSKVYWGELPKFTYATRAYNHPNGKDYKCYTSGTYCQLGDFICI